MYTCLQYLHSMTFIIAHTTSKLQKYFINTDSPPPTPFIDGQTRFIKGNGGNMLSAVWGFMKLYYIKNQINIKYFQCTQHLYRWVVCFWIC